MKPPKDLRMILTLLVAITVIWAVAIGTTSSLTAAAFMTNGLTVETSTVTETVTETGIGSEPNGSSNDRADRGADRGADDESERVVDSSTNQALAETNTALFVPLIMHNRATNANLDSSQDAGQDAGEESPPMGVEDPAATSTMLPTLLPTKKPIDTVTPTKTPIATNTPIPTNTLVPTNTSVPTNLPTPANTLDGRNADGSYTLVGTSMSTHSGYVDSNQPVSNLHTQDQFGTDNEWNRFVKFASENAPYQGYRSYFLPSNIDVANISSLQVETHYRGPATQRQIWTWHLFNWTTQSWTAIGDNSGAPWWGDWHWLSFDAGSTITAGSTADFVNVSSGEIRLNVLANNAVDSMDLDYEALVLEIGDPLGHDPAGIHHILVTGQSLAVGADSYPAVSPVSPNAQRGLHWNGASFEVKRHPSEYNNYPAVSLVHTLANNSTPTWAINTEGFGGASYQQLMNGSDVYNDQIANVEGAYAYAKTHNIPYSVDALVIIHGAAEMNNPNYAQHLLDWQNDYAVSVQQIVGSWSQIPLFTNQMSGAWEVATVHMEQLEAHLLNEDIYLVGPMYQYEHVDGLHLSGAGYYHAGEVMSRVLKKVLIDSEEWKPLRPINVSTQGNIVDVRYVVPQGSIQFDAQTVPMQGNYGFKLIDTTATIQNVSILSSDTVRLTLNKAPEAGTKVEYHYGNLRDSESARSELDGTPLPNWGVVFQLSAFQGDYYPLSGDGSQPPTPPMPPDGNEPTTQFVRADYIVTESGSINASQTVENLYEQDQAGAADEWNRFVKFVPGDAPYQGYRSYFLPNNISRSSISSLQVYANYRGPATERQIWAWRLFNWTTQSWVHIGDNGGAPWWGDWHWLSFGTGPIAVASAPTDFVNPSTGEIRVGLLATNTIDSMDLDYEAVVIEFDESVRPETPETTVVYAEDFGDFHNPERGFYESIEIETETNLDWVRDQGLSLVHAYVRLEEYRTRDLPDELLGEVERILNVAQASGLKVILRAAYNDPQGNYLNAQDAPIGWVKAHIQQLAPIFTRHSDVIAVYQVGFVGAWGEWHTSSNNLDSPENRDAILTSMLDAVPRERSVQLRYPGHLIDAYPTALTEEYAYNSSRWSRTGHHNDCVLANEYDAGTYRPQERRDEFRIYLDSIAPWVPVGGETCHESPQQQRTDCPTALAEFERFHWSYLNDDYYEPAIKRWKNEGCHDEISKRLGYRYRLLDTAVSAAAVAGMPLSLKLRMTNDGWAGIFNPRDVVLVLRNQGTGTDLRIPVVVDEARRWLPQPGTTKTLKVDVTLPVGMASGTYALYLELPDPQPSLAGNPAYSIRLANQLNRQSVWEAATGYNALGATVTVAQN